MELICVLSKKPKVCLAREENGWVICSGFRVSKRKDGRTSEQAVDPGYYGDNLGAALKAAYRRIVRGRAEPDSTIRDIYELCVAVAEELEVRTEGLADRVQGCARPGNPFGRPRGPAAGAGARTGRVSTGVAAGRKA